MIQYKKLMMTLALLLTAATGAWAAPKFGVTEITPDMVPASWANDNSGFTRNFLPGLLDNLTVNDANPWSGMPSGDVFLIYKYTQSTGSYGYVKFSNGINTSGGAMGSKRVLYLYVNNYKVYYATAYVEPDPNIIPVTPVAGQENQWEFDMPGSDVVLTPIYSVATVLGDDDTETSFASLKEAFANVQDGDVIKLDWNVTLTEHLATPSDGDGVKFTLDFNGYTIDGGTTYQIVLNNAGDQLTFTDSSDDQLGGLIALDLLPVAGSEFVFDAGRYNLNGATAETINGVCADSSIPLSLAEGKEFVDIEGAPDADGFMVRVAYKAIELTIGAGKFATFYAEQDFKVVEGTSIGLYTIMTEGIDLANNQITTSALNGSIIGGETPVLIYNGGSAQQTVKLQATTETAASQTWSIHFQGTAVDKTFTDDDMAAKDYYVLSGGSAFAPVKGKGTIAAHKCWLEFAKNNGNARSLKIVFDNGDATGIRSMDNGQLIMDNWYDLNGRKLNAKPTRKGVYIKNGQKVVK